MATGDILGVTVLATGWEAEVTIEGLSTGGTYAMDGSGATLTDTSTAKVVFTVVSEGYSAAGVLGTKTRTVYGTRARQKAYPNHATAEEAVVDTTNVKVTLALSDYLYDDDNTGSGKSGTAPTVTIGAGFYTQGGTPNNAVTGAAVTNNSTQDYPKVIARWAVVPYQRVTSTFDLECVAFHRFAENGKPVACVIFTHTDASTDPVAATAMVKSSAADSLPCYKRTITASNYTDNAVYNWQFTAYPWVGDADSVLTTVGGDSNALTLGPLPLVMDSDDDVPVYIACVNTSTGNDTTGVASTVYATAAAAPCATIKAALAKIHAANGNNADFGEILLQSNNHSIDGTGTGTTTSGWVTITRDYLGGTTKANAVITGAPSATLATAHVRIYDMTLAPTGLLLSGTTGRTLWVDNVATACASQVSDLVFLSFDLTYHTFNTYHQLDNPCGTASGVNQAALIRGCSATSARGLGTSSTAGHACTLTSSVSSDGLASTSRLVVQSLDNSIAAYNIHLCAVANVETIDSAANNSAMVCNVVEVSGDGELPACETNSGSSSDVTNKILWHNTIAGARHNAGYNAASPNHVLSQFSRKFCVDAESLCTKHDEFAEDGTLIGGWSFSYGVGWVGNHSGNDPSFPPKYSGVGSTISAWDATIFVDDQSLEASGTGNGDYHPKVGSVLIGKIPSSAAVVIPWDILGVAYASGGCGGAYTLDSGGGYRFWTYT